MPKKIKNLFYENLTYSKLLATHYRAKKNRTDKGEILRLELNLENNLINILTTTIRR